MYFRNPKIFLELVSKSYSGLEDKRYAKGYESNSYQNVNLVFIDRL